MPQPSPGTPQPGGPPSSALAAWPQETPACLSLSISSPAAPGSRCAVSTGTCSLARELIPRIQPLLTGRARGESSPKGSHSSVPATDFRPEGGHALLPHSQFSQKPSVLLSLMGGSYTPVSRLGAALPGHRRTQDPSVSQGQGSRPRRKPQLS